MHREESAMRRAISLAWQGAGWTNPNPLVGAVIVKDGRIIGEGYHERYGEPHAERNALADCVARGEDPRGATVYATLEPCCHWGKQPPCADALVEAGVACVVVGSRDPNPLVAGGGNARLRDAGIHVVEDVLRDECDALNPIFFHYIQTKRPYVVAKWAMTLDGKIATRTGDARWVSGEASRADVHELRHRLAAIMVGRGTAAADDPLLTARRAGASNQPVRVVVDSHLSLSETSQLVQTAREVPTLVGTAAPEDGPAAERLRALGVEVQSVPAPDGRVDLEALLGVLGERGVDSLLVEGGSALLGSLFDRSLVNEVVVYVAPKIAGGAQAKGPVAGQGVAFMADALALGAPAVERIGDDLKLVYRLAGDAATSGAAPAFACLSGLAGSAAPAHTPAPAAAHVKEGGSPCSRA